MTVLYVSIASTLVPLIKSCVLQSYGEQENCTWKMVNLDFYCSVLYTYWLLTLGAGEILLSAVILRSYFANEPTVDT